MIIKGQDVKEVPQEGRPLVLKRVINREEHTDRISVTWVRIWGHHEKIVSDLCDRVYYIISGEGVFQVEEEAEGRVSAGDFVFIPRGTPYVFDGQMTYIVMNGPAFVQGSDKVLE